jgi:excisionase family DNA binding protein
MEIGRLLWNVKETSQAMGISPWTVRRYIADGKLLAVRLGRRVLVEPSECRKFIEQSRKPREHK